MVGESGVSEIEVHLLAIRKALANRDAAVMVGSGFSRNAEDGEDLATPAFESFKHYKTPEAFKIKVLQ